ncbi:MAG: exonuclease domain-containing protein [Pseudorhodobacter sp.]|nr:exonuclease domain-containing protein [Pseudorhodobacter sp.]
MTFAFYDLETTGISPAFDQPLQFAALLTDDGFREIERVNLRCRIAPHIIPSPWALAVTGLRPAQLLDPGLPSLFEFTQDIADLIERWSPATWTGFNSIHFDEEMLRQAFYQNLQPDIFATQFNGNTRLDVLTLLYAVWYCQPDLFEWPIDETGRVRFKLDLSQRRPPPAASKPRVRVRSALRPSSPPKKSVRSRPRRWIASARPVIPASCRVRRGSLRIFTCGSDVSGWRSNRRPMRAESNQKALILLGIAYTSRPARAMLITPERCNSPPETTP